MKPKGQTLLRAYCRELRLPRWKKTTFNQLPFLSLLKIVQFTHEANISSPLTFYKHYLLIIHLRDPLGQERALARVNGVRIYSPEYLYLFSAVRDDLSEPMA